VEKVVYHEVNYRPQFL